MYAGLSSWALSKEVAVTEELDWVSIKSGLLDMARKRGAEVARVGDPALLEREVPLAIKHPQDDIPQPRLCAR